MAHIAVAQGNERDLPFNLRTKLGGDLTDDDDWNDGSTAEEWPSVEIKNPSTGADVTDDWVSDLTGVSISEATHTHPDPTTGLWRKDEGRYRLRVNPTNNTNILPLRDYNWTVFADIGGKQFDETHTIDLVAAGDVQFGDDVFTAIGADDILARVSTNLSTSEVETLLSQAADAVAGYLEDYYIDPDAFNSLDNQRTVKAAVIAQALIYVFDHDASANERINNLREGSIALGFAGNSNINRREKHKRIYAEESDPPGFLYRYVRSKSPQFKPHMAKSTRKTARNAHRRRDMRL